MGNILFCADRASLASPASLGLADDLLRERDWLEGRSDAVEARARLAQQPPIEEAWVASSDQMGAVNLAAALRRDDARIPLYLVAEGLSGSEVSRAQAAGVTGLLTPDGLARRVAHEDRRRLASAARAAAVRAAEASARPLGAGDDARLPIVCAPRPPRDDGACAWECDGGSDVEDPLPPPAPAVEAGRLVDVPGAPTAPSGERASASSLSAADTAPLPPVVPVAAPSAVSVPPAAGVSPAVPSAASASAPRVPVSAASDPTAPAASPAPAPPPAPAAPAVPPPASAPAAARPPAYVLSVVSGSGGAGKSTVAVLAACLAARRGLRTLLVDADLQFGDAADLLGSSGAPTVDEVLADPGLLDAPADAGVPALVAAPHRLELAEALAAQLPRLLEEASARFDVVVVNTGASWSEGHALVIERSARTLFLVDQRASSVRACRHALELCARCGIATGSFLFLLNRCAKGVPFTSLDVSCALQGAPVRELRDGGPAVEELLGSGLAQTLASERNDLRESLGAVLDGLLPGGSSGRGAGRGRKRGRGASEAPSEAPPDAGRPRGRDAGGRKAGRWGRRRGRPAVLVEAGAAR